MAARVAWWVIPASIVVLVRVVTLPGPDEPATVPATASPAPLAETADSPFATVVLRDAAGLRSAPRGLGMVDALVLHLPAGAADRRVEFALRRYGRDGVAPEPWLTGRPRLRGDATLRILNLPAGRYAVEIGWTAGGEARRVARDVDAPGTVDLR